jgi:hypothetical protein
METTRKAWTSPQVFVLGAEGTEAYKKGGTNESANHYAGLWTHTAGTAYNQIQPSSASTYDGYQS